MAVRIAKRHGHGEDAKTVAPDSHFEKADGRATVPSRKRCRTMPPITLDPRWFADEDFRFSLGTVPGTTTEFFAPSADTAAILAERRTWLRDDPQNDAALLPAGEPIAAELLELASTWPMLADATSTLRNSEVSLLDRLLILSEGLEPDLVLLAPQPQHGDRDTRFTVAGGCVCFPSMWRLTDKLGQSVDEVHQPVPQLNASIGAQIDRLLSRLRPGKCLVRANWSVCRAPELNQHPDRHLPALQSPVQPDEAWLRREDQCLFTLPRSGGVIFGIRVTHTAWSDLRQQPAVARHVARGLRTMPAGMLEYKRLNQVASELAALLDGA